MKAFPIGGGGGASAAEATSIAAGSTQGLSQEILAADGQVGKTVLAVGYTQFNGDLGPIADTKAQIGSLEDGNVVFVYASGADFLSLTVQEGPIFLSKGEVYVIENVQAGTIITATEGAYGFSQQRNGNNESPMPLLSLALAFTDTFFFGFRNVNSNEGFVRVVNGPIASSVTLFTGAGAVVSGQSDIALDPWEALTLSLSGIQEYRLVSTNKIMACTHANMDANAFFDSRLILPVTNDGITWPRNGDMSAPFANTVVNWYVNDNVTGQFTVSGPGSPVDINAAPPTGTGANDVHYRPRGATRFRAAGLVSAYSGADSAGLEASPLCPTSTFTQRIALPLYIRNAGDGADNGIALASIYKGTARLYQWNAGTGVADLVTVNDPSGTPVTEIPLIRRNASPTAELVATTRDQQFIPAATMISPNAEDGSSYRFLSAFTGGYIEVDVPCTCVFNSQQNENGSETRTFRGTSGATVVGIHSDDDEQLSYGITPDTIRTEVREGTDGLLYKRQIAAGGIDSWVLA